MFPAMPYDYKTKKLKVFIFKNSFKSRKYDVKFFLIFIVKSEYIYYNFL